MISLCLTSSSYFFLLSLSVRRLYIIRTRIRRFFPPFSPPTQSQIGFLHLSPIPIPQNLCIYKYRKASSHFKWTIDDEHQRQRSAGTRPTAEMKRATVFFLLRFQFVLIQTADPSESRVLIYYKRKVSTSPSTACNVMESPWPRWRKHTKLIVSLDAQSRPCKCKCR